MNLSITGLTTAQQMFVASPVAANLTGSGPTAVRESFSGSNSNGERASKRARRTRADTSVGSVDPGASDNNLSTTDVAPVKQTGNTAQSTSAVQKKGTGQAGKKKKRKARGGAQSGNNQARDRDDTPPAEEPIDPDEPTYCLCDQVSPLGYLLGRSSIYSLIFFFTDFLWRNDSLRQWSLSDRVVPLLLCFTPDQAQGQMVLS